MRSLFRLACALFLLTPMLLAQVRVTGEAPPPPPTPRPQVSVSDVIKMSNAGVSDEMIIQQIKKNTQPFDLTPDQLVRLKQNSVSERVVREMLGGTPPLANVAPATTGTSIPATEVPPDVGIYVKRHNKWEDVNPEIVDWKTGGVLKNTVTIGVVKQDLNGHLNGPTSQLGLALPIEFLVVTKEGVAVTEYQLLRLHQNSNNREFRTVTGGVFHVSGGARDTIPFEWTKTGPRAYDITIEKLPKGEYGLLPPEAIESRNAAGSQGKLYTFKVVE